MALPVGIDLGTTNSLVSILQRGVVETVPVDGRALLPSAVGVRPNGDLLVGMPARSMARINPTAVVTSAKRFIGDGVTTWQLQGRTYTPVDISTLVLERLKRAAEEYLGEPVRDAVITVPAYFSSNQKAATREAGERAGFNVLQLLPEPTAAAISYGLDKGKDQTILVYDLGGGTFDVSILKIERNSFQVVAVGGDFHLGGDDFDQLLALHLCSLLPPSGPNVALLHACIEGTLPEGSTPPVAVLTAAQQLLEAAERAKIDLSNPAASSVFVTLPDILGNPFECEVTLTEYNRLIEPLVRSTMDVTLKVISDARMTVEDLDRVVLVGGSTRNRLVKQVLTDAIKEPWISERVDEAVVHGAAIFANAARLASPIKVRNVTAFNLGVRATKAGDGDHFQQLIAKNTGLPTSQDLVFTTEKTNQKSVKIAIFQGDSLHCKENTFVGGFLLEGIPPAPAGVPEITVMFQMDDSDILRVTASCKQQQTSHQLDVNRVSRDMESKPANADILFLIDTSGSMSTEIEGVKRSCVAFAEQVQSAGIDCRLGVVDFDKSGSSYKWEVFGPMDPPQLPDAIRKLAIGRLGGSGCYIGEAATIPVMEAFVKAFRTPERTKIGVLISDEVGNDATSVKKLIRILNDAGVTLFVLGVPGSCHEQIAEATGGGFWDILASRGDVDMSHVLHAIAAEITNLALR